jgi:hypothetical protein
MLAQKGESAVAQRLAAIEQACQAFGVVVIKEELDYFLLLGESKYYYAVEDENGELVVKDDGDPAHPPSNRVQNVVFSVQKTEGDKLGVYWEKKYPLWDGDTFKVMADLLAGMIRLVGRYWKEENYRVISRKRRLAALCEISRNRSGNSMKERNSRRPSFFPWTPSSNMKERTLTSSKKS